MIADALSLIVEKTAIRSETRYGACPAFHSKYSGQIGAVRAVRESNSTAKFQQHGLSLDWQAVIRLMRIAMRAGTSNEDSEAARVSGHVARAARLAHDINRLACKNRVKAAALHRSSLRREAHGDIMLLQLRQIGEIFRVFLLDLGHELRSEQAGPVEPRGPFHRGPGECVLPA